MNERERVEENTAGSIDWFYWFRHLVQLVNNSFEYEYLGNVLLRGIMSFQDRRGLSRWRSTGGVGSRSPVLHCGDIYGGEIATRLVATKGQLKFVSRGQFSDRIMLSSPSLPAR